VASTERTTVGRARLFTLLNTFERPARTVDLSPPSVFAACDAASMTAQDSEPKPDQRPEDRCDEGEQPEGPSEFPDEEVKRDLLGVLNHEEDEYCSTRERGKCPATES
jgi:hypothetical protein